MVVMKYTSKEIREKYKITIQTLYNWRNLDKIKFEKLSIEVTNERNEFCCIN